jgi:glucose/arabinose dehydrogenase
MRPAAITAVVSLLVILGACAQTGTPPGSGASTSVTKYAGSRPGVCDARQYAASPSRSARGETGLQVPNGFTIETIASIGGARELAALPNGDLIVGTDGSNVYIVPDAEGAAAAPQVFAAIDDSLADGVAFTAARCEIYVATENHVWRIPYHGERKASEVDKIADVRTGPEAPGTDGDVHTTTSVAFTDGHVYAAAGSSCNAKMDYGTEPCTEVDPTRAAVSIMKPDGSDFHQRAKRVRNAIALAVNPDTQSLWIGGAGQDRLRSGHPYEYLDDLSAHPGDADYGWPVCEEDHHVYWRGYHCGKTVAPLVELPAYSTIIGATFYPLHQTGFYAFPSEYRGGLFAAAHGSWHKDRNGCSVDAPHVVFVAMQGDSPVTSVDWNDPTKQWSEFVTGFQSSCNTRVGRATGITVGPKGSLFIADDHAGAVYRVRPTR